MTVRFSGQFSQITGFKAQVPLIHDPFIANVATILTPAGLTNTQLTSGFSDGRGNTFTATSPGLTISNAVTYNGASTFAFVGADSAYFSSEANPAAFNLGTKDFTMECWVNVQSLINTQGVFEFVIFSIMVPGTTTNNTTAFLVAIDGPSATIVNNIGTTGFNSSAVRQFNLSTNMISSFALNTWHHFAFCRTGGLFYNFIDGVLQGTSSIGSYAFPFPASCKFNIGALPLPGFTYPLNGNIANVRITMGVARYTSNFTPPVNYPTS